jgi:alcohol dehydrogenase (cytochrome c)/quinohemoprotein ethanol dehydrogenase
MKLTHAVIIALAAALAACGPPKATVAAVDAERLANADAEPGNWMSYGRTYGEQRYSPLDSINAGNASRLGLAWYADLDTNRGQEATPLVIDGRMYVSTAWSKVKAYNATTGDVLWQFDPKVPLEFGVKTCCDVVNRGVAAWNGKIYVGTLDGRLIALNAHNGLVVWEMQTVDATKPYSITGAPRVVDGKVIIGNGGAEFGVRGYVSAYDAEDGELVWRFYTVPGDPAKGFEQPALETAAKTWTGQWWKLGGGGTVWDAITYDPELNLVYIGVGNGSPWSQKERSPGGGDNLFLSSIVALKADTGEYVWHYQTTPGDEWDYTATQPIILADISIGGRVQKVLMQAPKNGFFYVIDRTTGHLISAKNFVPITWATGVDMRTGRPVENPAARYSVTGKPWVSTPGPLGAHSWQPMAYSPKTGLVYIPANETTFPYIPERGWRASPMGFNIGIDLAAGSLPQDPAIKAQVMSSLKGALIAWDPVNQREVWRVQHQGPWNGGILATAGNLVVQGSAAAEFAVYRADTGAKLWSMPVQTGVVAAPMTYAVSGTQYIAVLAGWGGAYTLPPGELSFKSGRVPNISRLLVFKLGGNGHLPPAPPRPDLVLNPPPATADAATVDRGKAVYSRFCSVCHGDAAVSGGLVPDLRYSNYLAGTGWDSVVLDGLLRNKGMAPFKSVLNRDQAEAIRAYVVARANESKPPPVDPSTVPPPPNGPAPAPTQPAPVPNVPPPQPAP